MGIAFIGSQLLITHDDITRRLASVSRAGSRLFGSGKVSCVYTFIEPSTKFWAFHPRLDSTGLPLLMEYKRTPYTLPPFSRRVSGGTQEHHNRLELSTSAWRAGILPLHQWCINTTGVALFYNRAYSAINTLVVIFNNCPLLKNNLLCLS